MKTKTQTIRFLKRVRSLKAGATATACACVLAIFGAIPASDAAVLTGNFTTGAVGTVDLTAVGVTDWRTFGGTDNEKVGGTQIGAATASPGDNAGTIASGNFTWTNGTPVSTGSTDESLFASSATLANPISLTFTVSPGTTNAGTMSIWFGLYRSDSTITVSAPGATTYTSVFSQGDFGSYERRYDFSFQLDSPTDALTITIADNNTPRFDEFGNVRLNAAAVNAVPEPSSLMLVVISGALIAFCLRRRSLRDGAAT